MPENYVEEVVDEWLRIQGYITMRNVPFWRPRGQYRKQAAWGDVDIVAVKGDEVLLIECKEFLGTKKISDLTKELVLHFKEAEDVFLGRVKNPYGVPAPDISGKRIKRLLIAAAPKNVDSYKQALEPYQIEVIHFRSILSNLISHLKKHIKPWQIVGKYGPMARLLIALIQYGVI